MTFRKGAVMGWRPWFFPGAPLYRLPPRSFEEHEDSRNRTPEMTETAGFVELRALRTTTRQNRVFLTPFLSRAEARWRRGEFWCCLCTPALLRENTFTT